MRIVVILALITSAAVALAQSPAKPQHTTPAKKELSPAQQMWCPVLEYALTGAKSLEPPMRAYLLDIAALGLGKCDPAKVSATLVDSFNATLLIPEKEEDFPPSASRDETTVEAYFRMDTKRELQQSALRHLAAVDEAKAEVLLERGEPSVRTDVLRSMISRAITAKKYNVAQKLLSRVPAVAFPYGEATDLMLQLPSSRDADKQELFRLAMAADRERHILIIGGDDFGSMIVRFWKHVPPSVALQAIHQVLDAAQSRETAISLLSTSGGSVGFTSEYEYRLFELMPVLRQLDDSEAAQLLKASQRAQLQLKQFPNGIQSLNPAIGDTSPKDGEQSQIGGSVGPASSLGQDLQVADAANAFRVRVNEILRTAGDNPRQAIAAAASLPNSNSAARFGSANPRADALLAVANAVMSKNPSAAEAALEEMAEALKSGLHPYGAIEAWTEGMKIATQIGENDLALSMFRSGMDQADVMGREDSDSDDPNIALKAWWPSASARWQLVRAASEVSPGAALERIREVKDPEILLLLEIGLADKNLGAHLDQSITSVRKRKDPTKDWSEYRGMNEE